jgi:hypothetical protein
MATALQSVPRRVNPFEWLWSFLREELAPYSGRGALVARMVAAATIVMIVDMAFRIRTGIWRDLRSEYLTRKPRRKAIVTIPSYRASHIQRAQSSPMEVVSYGLSVPPEKQRKDR